MEPTIDILATLAAKKEKQLVVGFALETENEIENAKKKLKNKNLDLIVLNSLNSKDAGFNVDTNQVILIFKDGHSKEFETKSKKEVAKDILNEVINWINE